MPLPMPRLFLAFVCFFIFSCSGSVPIQEFPVQASFDRDAFYFTKVRPLLDNRCVACHACYTSPCQLNLAEHEGIRRGATKIRLYEGSRLTEIAPTRLGIDAQNYVDWQKKEFFPVAGGGESSLMMALVKQRQINQAPVTQKSKESFLCPKDSGEMVDFLAEHAEKGMPYGLPPLTDAEAAIMSRWLQEGYPALSEEGLAQLALIKPEEAEQIKIWEDKLNLLDPKSRLVARYLYEHLFLGVIEFSEAPGTTFRLVRSATRYPEAVYPIPTRRPYDDAGIFFYRFQKMTATVTHKNHMIYTLSPERMKRFDELFYKSKWNIKIDEYPSYKVEVAANPFEVYKAIPATSRYQFLLDSSLYFVSTFIKGSVCEGEAAVSVIDEKFFIFFADPNNRSQGALDAFTAHVARDLAIPNVDGFMDAFYGKYKASQMDFVNERKKMIDAVYPLGLSLYDIWDGAGKNNQAVLTVFRHDDNSYVRHGAIGEVPKTAWVMDYPIFERMYYLLAAGFDVFGSVSHQASTRLYMDNLRVESEDLFLSFLPAEDRDPIRKGWYRGEFAKKKMEWLNPYGGATSSPKIVFQSSDRKAELIQKILNERMTPNVRGLAPLKACCGERDTAVTRALNRLTLVKGNFIKSLPDIALIYIEHSEGQRGELFSLIRHKSHLNISFMLAEEDRLVPNEDTITIQQGVMGSFPNFLFYVKENDVDAFVKRTLAIKDQTGPEFQAWLKDYGVSRKSPEFWTYFDKAQVWFDQEMDNRGGILDLSKYELW